MRINSAKLAGLLIVAMGVCLLAPPRHAGTSGNLQMLDLLPDAKRAGQEIFVPEELSEPARGEEEVSVLLPLLEEGKEQSSDDPPRDKQRVLIYHTHLTEAYRQTENESYRESSEYRTFDRDYNVAAVGTTLKNALERLGYEVIHDTTDHEPPKLATAYERSLITMEKYEDIDLYIDLHRDASGAANIDDVVEIDGKRCARMMFVVGKGLKSDGTEYDPKPNFEKTYALAQSIGGNLNEFHSDFMRETRVKRGRYNQHVSENCILVEIGHNMNTLSEAKNAAGYLAAAIDKTLHEMSKG